MKVIKAIRGGYCYGVKRALDIANEAAGKAAGPIYTLGPIIHNPGVVSNLAEAGVSPVDKIYDITSGTVILRSHGVSPEVVDEAEHKGLNIVDATCPYVKVAQEKAAALRQEGYLPIILGEHEHPEVVALAAHAGARAQVVEKADELDLEALKSKSVGVVVQTTQASENLAEVAARLAPVCRHLLIHNTMCNATQKTQQEALDLSLQADAVVVIGGRNSANTTRLAQLCRRVQQRTYHIEDVLELREEWFEGAEVVAITAGASTPPEQMISVEEWLLAHCARLP